MQASIEIIPSDKIDKTKWNACVYNSSNGIIYATFEYLNFMSDSWHGIIVNDYECVMPIPWRRKWGIRYSYEIPFVQQLGWFQQTETDHASLMLEHFFKFIKYGDYAFNFKNGKVENASLCNNYVIDLSLSYGAIQKKFNTDLSNNLKKAYKQELIYAKSEF